MELTDRWDGKVWMKGTAMEDGMVVTAKRNGKEGSNECNGGDGLIRMEDMDIG
jgi:hypothetical protein